jgi:hypothetical protein
MDKRERRTQEALVAALRARPRTTYRAGQCGLVAEASSFSSLLAVSRFRCGLLQAATTKSERVGTGNDPRYHPTWPLPRVPSGRAPAPLRPTLRTRRTYLVSPLRRGLRPSRPPSITGRTRPGLLGSPPSASGEREAHRAAGGAVRLAARGGYSALVPTGLTPPPGSLAGRASPTRSRHRLLELVSERASTPA